jgi:hypothetical protein
MKRVQKPGFDRFFKRRQQRPGRKAVGQPKDRAAERKEALVLLAIALLFVANVVIYLCHHYGLTSLNEWQPRAELTARSLAG